MSTPSLTAEEVAAAGQGVVLQAMQPMQPQLRVVPMPVMMTVPQPMGILNGMNMNMNLFQLQQMQTAAAATPVAEPVAPLAAPTPTPTVTPADDKSFKQLLPTPEITATIIRTLRRNDPASTFLIADDAVVATPTLGVGKVPFAGSFVGKSGMMEFTRKLHGEWQLLEVEEQDRAQTGKTIFMTVYFKLRSPTGSIYSSYDPVIIVYNGKCITSIKIYFATPEIQEVALAEGISPPELSGFSGFAFGEQLLPTGVQVDGDKKAAVPGAGKVLQQRLVPQSSPCGHNSWDNVRIKKGDITFRCRICQSQWRTEVANSSRCADFQAGHCDKGANCTDLHVHAHKQSLSQRLSQFGGTVLERVPIHQWSNPV